MSACGAGGVSWGSGLNDHLISTWLQDAPKKTFLYVYNKLTTQNNVFFSNERLRGAFICSGF